MPAAAQSSVNISFRAANRVLELGLWPEFKAMIDRTVELIPDLHAISVSFDDQAKEGESSIVILAEVDPYTAIAPGRVRESPEWRWNGWAAETFSGDVLTHFCMMRIPAAEKSSNGR